MPSVIDFALCALPKYATFTPLSGPALLKTVLETNGFKAKYYDFNKEFESVYQKIFPGKSWSQLESVLTYRDRFKAALPQLRPLLDQWAERLLENEPRFVGFSAFTFCNNLLIVELAQRVRDKSTAKIVVGGASVQSVSRLLRAKGLLDYWVAGEGENAVLALARGENEIPGVNGTPTQDADIRHSPVPDYSDLEMTSYAAIYVMTSRSCPRNCTFCEVGHLWGKYRERDPKLVAEEFRHHRTRWGIKKFVFTDSLINGSMTHYRALCAELIALREQEGLDFGWEGFFIVRPASQMTPEDFDLARRAGATLIKIGVESGSEAVREHMQKNYTQAQLDYTMEQFKRSGLQVDLLLMIGYPTETQADFQATLDLLVHYKHYKEGGTIANIRLMPTEIMRGSPLARRAREIGITVDPKGFWKSPEVDVIERLERYFKARKLAFDLGYEALKGPDADRMDHYGELYRRLKKPQKPAP